MNIKIKLNFFVHNKLKFQPRTSKTVMFNANMNCSVQCKCELFCILKG